MKRKSFSRNERTLLIMAIVVMVVIFVVLMISFGGKRKLEVAEMKLPDVSDEVILPEISPEDESLPTPVPERITLKPQKTSEDRNAAVKEAPKKSKDDRKTDIAPKRNVSAKTAFRRINLKPAVSIYAKVRLPNLHPSYADNVQQMVDEVYAPYISNQYRQRLAQPGVIDYLHAKNIDVVLVIDRNGKVTNFHLVDFPASRELNVLKEILKYEIANWVFKEVNQYGRCRVQFAITPRY